jgi:hypothetical protein
MHDRTKSSPLVDEKLRWYEEKVRALLEAARRRYDEVRFALVSDHGMATTHTVVDLMPRLSALDLRFGVDFIGVYDSTMLRFWFFSPSAEERVRQALPDDALGGWVSEKRLRAYGTYWPDGKFGQAIYALEPGVLLNPSHMGRVAPAGMHGYRPDHPDSDASLLADFEPVAPVADITGFYGVMREMSAWAMAT